jgi:hypothetical protein
MSDYRPENRRMPVDGKGRRHRWADVVQLPSQAASWEGYERLVEDLQPMSGSRPFQVPHEPTGVNRANSSSPYQCSSRVRRTTSRWAGRR